jgi:hypothetical protein
MNVKVTLYDDDELFPFNNMSSIDIDFIESTINHYYRGSKRQFPYILNDEEQEFGMIFNIDEKKIEEYLNKKILIKPMQYDLYPWSDKMEIMFEKYIFEKIDEITPNIQNNIEKIDEPNMQNILNDINDILNIKKQIKCSKCKKIGHNKRSCK